LAVPLLRSAQGFWTVCARAAALPTLQEQAPLNALLFVRLCEIGDEPNATISPMDLQLAQSSPTRMVSASFLFIKCRPNMGAAPELLAEEARCD